MSKTGPSWAQGQVGFPTPRLYDLWRTAQILKNLWKSVDNLQGGDYYCGSANIFRGKRESYGTPIGESEEWERGHMP